MKRFLLDVNVVLDVLLDRPPFAEAARALWAAAERREVEAFIPAHGVTTVFYLASRRRDARFARRVTHDLLSVAGVAAVDGVVLRRAITLATPDFEDAVCLAAAEAAGCGAVVTRDPAGYRDAAMAVVDPLTAVALIHGPGTPGMAEARRPSSRNKKGRRVAATW